MAWRASVGFRGVATRRLAPSTQVSGLDRGISVTAALADGTHYRMPGFLKEARDAIGSLQRERALQNKESVEWKKLNRRIAKAYRRAKHQSENWARHVSREIVGKQWSHRHRGPQAHPDVQVGQRNEGGTREERQREGRLNRSLQEAALGRLSYSICVKAEEAGRRLWKVNPKDSSRECAACGHT